jgi:hypothetical protein
MTTKTLELALSKASELPEAAQEEIGRDVLESVETLARLRAEVAEQLLLEIEADD